nr:hypothetical protein [Anopheline-associated C virus]
MRPSIALSKLLIPAQFGFGPRVGSACGSALSRTCLSEASRPQPTPLLVASRAYATGPSMVRDMPKPLQGQPGTLPSTTQRFWSYQPSALARPSTRQPGYGARGASYLSKSSTTGQCCQYQRSRTTLQPGCQRGLRTMVRRCRASIYALLRNAAVRNKRSSKSSTTSNCASAMLEGLCRVARTTYNSSTFAIQCLIVQTYSAVPRLTSALLTRARAWVKSAHNVPHSQEPSSAIRTTTWTKRTWWRVYGATRLSSTTAIRQIVRLITSAKWKLLWKDLTSKAAHLTAHVTAMRTTSGRRKGPSLARRARLSTLAFGRGPRWTSITRTRRPAHTVRMTHRRSSGPPT